MKLGNFASEHDRDEAGRIIFPRDTEMRHHFFPYTDPAEHVAKCNMLMIQEVVEHFTSESEIILDPFAGTGTIMVAATLNRKVIMIELLDVFCETIELNIIGVRQSYPNIDGLVTLIPGNAAAILPIPDFCDHIITSTPYPQGLKKKGTMDKTSKDLGYQHAADYSDDMRNFTNLNDFIYHQRIAEFYKKCFNTIKPGGTLTTIIKDKMENGQRVMQADRALRDCEKIGFVLMERNKWLAMGGGYSAINRSAGLETVDEEDLITLRRPI